MHDISDINADGAQHKDYKNLGISSVDMEETGNTEATQNETGIRSKVLSILSNKTKISKSEVINLHRNNKRNLIEKLSEVDQKMAA